MVLKAHRNVNCTVQRQVVAAWRITEQRQSGERISDGAGSDQNAEGCTGEEIEHKNQVKRPNTISAKIITDLTRYRPIVLELI